MALGTKVCHPEFEVRMGLTRDYDALFRQSYTKEASAEGALAASEQGRLLIAGRGGSAKTATINRYARQIAKDGHIPIIVSLYRWTASNYDGWSRASTLSARMDYLLQNFSRVRTTCLELDAIPSDQKRVLFIDGLNEVTSWIGQDIIYAADDFVRYGRNASVVVSDRLVRREFESINRWQLAVVLPLSDAEIRRVVDPARFAKLSVADRQRLTLPFFLDAFLKGGRADLSHAEEFERRFQEVGLSAEQIRAAAAAAFQAYQDRSRTFSFAKFSEVSGHEAANILLEKGELLLEAPASDRCFFEHHLKHDFLASKHLAADPALWTSANFRAITFNGGSFDSLAMAMEQIEGTAPADLFLRNVYDWNFYGSGYALAESAGTDSSREMQLVILAMFAERRWDLMRSTAKRANDTLSLIQSPDANALKLTTNLEGIFEHIRSVQDAADWFLEWRRTFVRAEGSPAQAADFERLEEQDSVRGWTASNVLKRLSLSADQEGLVRATLNHPDWVIQWRAAHVLGALPKKANIDALVEVLKDATRKNEVLYGSIRSMVEIAIRNPELGKIVFDQLAVYSDAILSNDYLMQQFASSLIVRRNAAPPQWAGMVLPMVTLLEAKSKSAEQSDQWSRLLGSMAVYYSK